MALSAFDDPKAAPTAAARAEGLPGPILELIANAPKYAEGRGFRIPIRTAKDTKGMRELVAIKLAN